MKIILVVPSLVGGGAERVTVMTANAMAERGHDVVLVTALSGNDLKHLIANNVRYIGLNRPSLRSAIIPLADVLKKEQPDTLFSAMTYTNCFAAISLRLSRTPAKHIMSVHGYSPTPYWPGKINGMLGPRLVRYFYPKADAIVAVSQAVREILLSRMNLSPLKTIHIYNPGPTIHQKADHAPHPWMNEEHPVLLAVGRLSREKDYPTLLKAFEKLQQSRPAKLVILGQGPQLKPLQNLAEELGITENICFAGFVHNVQDYMQYADAYISTSLHEALQGTLVEAMTFNLPTVCTRSLGGAMEVVQDGKYGLVRATGDVMGLAEAMAEVIQSPDAGRGEAALERFDQEQIFDAYERVLTGRT